MTKETTSFVYVTYILSTPEKVFEAITRPDVARRYWGHENVSDWKPGSRWEHIRANDERTVARQAFQQRHREPGLADACWSKR